jgi:hypothetical protein
MKIYLDNLEIFEITNIDRLLLEHDLIDVDNEIKRRLEYIIKHKVDQCYSRLKSEWDKKFQSDVNITSVPTKRDDYVALVIAHPDYKNRSVREAEISEV